MTISGDSAFSPVLYFNLAKWYDTCFVSVWNYETEKKKVLISNCQTLFYLNWVKLIEK